MDDDEDVIVRKKKSRKIKTVLDSDDEEGSESELEFDVVVCNELPNTELYRLHFPDRKKDAFNFERHPRIRYKKNVKMMEMRLAPDISSGSFDKEKAERFAAMNLPSVKSENDIALTKFDEIYEGRSYVRDDYVQFAVGYFRENTFFLSPIAGTFEMHMSLAHLNNATKVNREDDGEASGESDSESPKADAKQIRVKFARLETERQKKRREASALYREKLIASDSWIPMEVHLKEEPLVEEKLTQMTPLPFNESKNFEELTTRDLVERGIICDERQQIDLTRSNVLVSQQEIREMPIHQQVMAQLFKSRVIRTDDMVRLVCPSVTREELFQHLQECGRLVQGVWVLKSEFLFHDLTVAHSTTLGKLDEHRAEMWRCARDLALCILDFGQPITRALLIRCFKINSKDAEDILSTFAVPGDKTWKLRIAPDPVFSESPENASIVLEERRYWVEKWRELRNMIDNTLSLRSPSRTRKNTSASKSIRSPVRRRRNSSRGSSFSNAV